MIEFKTSKGTFKVQLFDKQAPVSVENFLRYVDEGFFDGTIFHRVIAGLATTATPCSGAWTRGWKSWTRSPR